MPCIFPDQLNFLHRNAYRSFGSGGSNCGKVVDYIAVGQVAWCPSLREHVGNTEQCPLIRGFAFLGFSYPQSIAV